MGQGQSADNSGCPQSQLPRDDEAYARGDVVRIVVMSDTHNAVTPSTDPATWYVPPDGDVFLHAGDFTCNGTEAEARLFNTWLATLQHMHKIVIPGNHDLCCDAASLVENVAMLNSYRRALHANQVAQIHAQYPNGLKTYAEQQQRREALKRTVLAHCRYEDGGHVMLRVVPRNADPDVSEAAELSIAIWPYTDVISVSGMRAFARSEADQRQTLQSLVEEPPGAWPPHILLTHGPPRGVLDTFLMQSAGSQPLAECLATQQSNATTASALTMRASPLYHVFGHVHKQRGVQRGAALSLPRGEAITVPTVFVNAACATGRKSHRLVPEPVALIIDIPCSELQECTRNSPSTQM